MLLPLVACCVLLTGSTASAAVARDIQSGKAVLTIDAKVLHRLSTAGVSVLAVSPARGGKTATRTLPIFDGRLDAGTTVAYLGGGLTFVSHHTGHAIEFDNLVMVIGDGGYAVYGQIRGDSYDNIELFTLNSLKSAFIVKGNTLRYTNVVAGLTPDAATIIDSAFGTFGSVRAGLFGTFKVTATLRAGD